MLLELIPVAVTAAATDGYSLMTLPASVICSMARALDGIECKVEAVVASLFCLLLNVPLSLEVFCPLGFAGSLFS